MFLSSLCSAIFAGVLAASGFRGWNKGRSHQVHALVAVIRCFIERLFGLRLAERQTLREFFRKRLLIFLLI